MLNVAKNIHKESRNYAATTSTKNLASAAWNEAIKEGNLEQRLQEGTPAYDDLAVKVGMDKAVTNAQKSIIQGGTGS
ncbi:MAG: hypothetical protein HC932_02250 [Thermales bacterium]|nr:hypothetical protein [Thermales bacterium]